MSAYYASAYRAANLDVPTWKPNDGYTVGTDSDSLLDATGNLEFTAPVDGLLIWSLSIQRVDQGVWGRYFHRHYIDDALWPPGWTNLYGGQHLGGGRSFQPTVYSDTYFMHIPMLAGEVHRWDHYSSHATHDILGDIEKHRTRHLFIPTGEGPTTQILGMSGNLGPWAGGPTFRRLTGFDRPMTTDTSWVGVDEETFTMPADGYLITHFHTHDVSNVNRQQLRAHLRIHIDADGGLVRNIGGRKLQQTSWGHVIPSPIVPVSAGDEILVDWQHEAIGDSWEHRGYDSLADGNEYSFIVLQLFT